MLQSLRTPLLFEAIQDQIKQYILDQGLEPGDRIPTEERISLEIGAGRNVVREALRAMESLGFIEARHGEGRFVRAFNFDAILTHLPYAVYFGRDSLDEMWEVRAVLEVGVVERAMETLTDDDLHEIQQIYEDMKANATAGKPYLDQDSNFHRKIFSKLGNQSLMRLLNTYWGICYAVEDAEQVVSRSTKHLEQILFNHRQIVDALLDRDRGALRMAMQRHFDFARERRSAPEWQSAS